MSCKSGQLWKEFSMYFLPLCELESYSASNYLKENVKLVREIELPVVVAPNYSVCESDGNILVFTHYLFPSAVVVFNIANDGFVECINKNMNIPNSSVMTWSTNPAGFIVKHSHNSNEYKSTLQQVICKNSLQWLTLDFAVEFDHVFTNSKILQHSGFLILLTSDFQYGHRKYQRESRPKYMVILQLQGDATESFYYKEIFRNKLEEISEDIDDIQGIQFNMHHNKILFSLFQRSRDQKLNHYICIFNVKKLAFEDFLEITEVKDKTSQPINSFYLSYNEFKEPLIVAVIPWENKALIFSKEDEQAYYLAKTILLNIENLNLSGTVCYCISNRKNKLVLVFNDHSKIFAIDLLKPSDCVALCDVENMQTRIGFNNSGEEIYICYRNKVQVFIYRSSVKRLTELCSTVISKVYTKSDLHQLRLPKLLYEFFDQ